MFLKLFYFYFFMGCVVCLGGLYLHSQKYQQFHGWGPESETSIGQQKGNAFEGKSFNPHEDAL